MLNPDRSIAGPGSAIMEAHLRRTRAADLCDMLDGYRARIDRLHNLGRDMTPDEDAAYTEAERDRSDAERELRALVVRQLGVSADRLKEVL